MDEDKKIEAADEKADVAGDAVCEKGWADSHEKGAPKSADKKGEKPKKDDNR